MSDQTPQTGRIAVVTGSNRGIGFEVCRQLAQRGVRIILTGRDEKKGQAAVGRPEAEGLAAGYQPLDVTDPVSCVAATF